MSWLTGQYLLFGNAAAWIKTDARGAVAALVPLPWPSLSVQVVGSTDGPRLAYDVMQGGPDAALLGLPTNTRLLDSDVLHVRARSDNGAIGRSVLSRASDPLREGLEIQTVATANWRNGMRPSAVLSAPAYLSSTQEKRFDAEWMARFAGAMNTGKIPLLEGGWKLEQASLSSVDAQFAEMRQLSVAEIARMFGVPEQLIQPASRSIADLTPYVTTFAQLALTPIVTAIEAEFDYAVLPSGLHLDLDLASSMMRGSFSAATAAMAALVQSGIISPNDAREELGWSPHPDGAALRVGGAPNYPPDFTGSTAMHPSPGPADGQPQMPSHGNSGSQGNGSMVLQ
jgi:HK97 family phage portal protein